MLQHSMRLLEIASMAYSECEVLITGDPLILQEVDLVGPPVSLMYHSMKQHQFLVRRPVIAS